MITRQPGYVQQILFDLKTEISTTLLLSMDKSSAENQPRYIRVKTYYKAKEFNMYL